LQLRKKNFFYVFAFNNEAECVSEHQATEVKPEAKAKNKKSLLWHGPVNGTNYRQTFI